MEGTTQLNTARNMDLHLCCAKPMGKGKSESAKKMFGEILLEMQGANPSATLNKSDSKVSCDKKAEDGRIIDTSFAAMALELPIEAFRKKTPVCEGGMPVKTAEKSAGMPETAKAFGLGVANMPDPIAAGMEKAMIAQAESDDSGKGNGVASSVMLRENAYSAEGGEAFKKPLSEVLHQNREMMPEGKKTDLLSKVPGSAENPKPVERQNSQMIAKPWTWEFESGRALEFSEGGKDEKALAQPARGIGELNRFAQKEMPKGESDFLSDTGETKPLLGKAIETKAFFREQAEPKPETHTKGKGAESFAKSIEEASGGEPLDGSIKTGIKAIGAAEKASGGAIENFDEIAGKIEFAMDKIRDKGKNVMRVRLQPEELGTIEIRLEQENGIVKGRILVENETIKEQLGSLLAGEKALSVQDGQKPREIEVQVFNQHAGEPRDFGQSAFSFQRNRGNVGFEEFAVEKTDGPIEQIEDRRPVSGGLDMFA